MLVISDSCLITVQQQCNVKSNDKTTDLRQTDRQAEFTHTFDWRMYQTRQHACRSCGCVSTLLAKCLMKLV